MNTTLVVWALFYILSGSSTSPIEMKETFPSKASCEAFAYDLSRGMQKWPGNYDIHTVCVREKRELVDQPNTY